MIAPAAATPRTGGPRDLRWALALSGGGDSTALLHLACRAGRPPAVALIVDHALSPQSAAMAAGAAEIAASAGIAPRILRLTWRASPPTAQAAWRRARLEALAKAAEAAGVAALALAHTADDQAETVLMRAARGSTWRGLAGMAAKAPTPVWPQGRTLAWVRPLLGVPRAALRAWLKAEGESWIEDPANANPRFLRIRARAFLAASDRRERLLAIAREAAAHAARLDAAAHAALADLEVEPHGTLRLPAGALLDCPPPVRARALAGLVAAASGARRLLDMTEASGLARRIAEEGSRAWTFAGAWVERRSDLLILRRDPGALQGRRDGAPGVTPMSLKRSETAAFDGRLALTAHRALTVRAGPRGHIAVAADGVRLSLSDAAKEGWLHAQPLAHERLRQVFFRGLTAP